MRLSVRFDPTEPSSSLAKWFSFYFSKNYPPQNASDIKKEKFLENDAQDKVTYLK
jgi:hypothetical protein